LELSIEGSSTRRLDEGVAQARAMQLFELSGAAIERAAMFPMANWKGMLDDVGDAMNVPELGTKSGVEAVQAAAMQGQLPAQQEAAAQAKMSGDTAAPKPPKSMARPNNTVQRPQPKANKAPQKEQGKKARMAGVT